MPTLFRYPVLPTLVESTFIIVGNTLTTIIEISALILPGITVVVPWNGWIAL